MIFQGQGASEAFKTAYLYYCQVGSCCFRCHILHAVRIPVFFNALLVHIKLLLGAFLKWLALLGTKSFPFGTGLLSKLSHRALRMLLLP